MYINLYITTYISISFLEVSRVLKPKDLYIILYLYNIMVKIQYVLKRKVIVNRASGHKFIMLPKKKFQEGDYVIINEETISKVRKNGNYLIATVPREFEENYVDVKKLEIFGGD